MHLRLIAAASLAALTSAQAQITTVRPNVPRLTAIVAPDVPLLIGLNSGTAIQIDDMTGAAAQTFSDGFWIGRTSAAPVLGRGINGQLIALVPGQIPQRQILLPSPGWQALERIPPLVNFTIDPSGSVLYGVSCDAGMVIRYDMATQTSQMIGSKGTGPGQLECPEKIAVDASGRIYVADKNRIVRMNDITGNGWTAFGTYGSGNGQFNYIRGIAVDRKNRIYVSDFFNSRIVRIDDINGAGWTTYSAASPEGVAVDSYDRLYIALPVGNKIVRLDDITGAGEKTFTVARDAGYAGPKIIVPLKGGTTARPVIR